MSEKPAQLVHVDANAQGRDLAVGDIHGCFSALQAALNSIGFQPAMDRLFSVGDLVDRGPESHLVLEWLDKPWFHAICGNHDLMAWRSALGAPYPDVSHAMHGGNWLQQLDGFQQQRIGQALASLPLAMEVQTSNGLVGLVHADCPYDDWSLMQRQALSAQDRECCLWSMERYQRSYARPIQNVHAVVHGHITIHQMKQLGNVFFIDTGGWRPGQGHFTFLDLQTLKPIKGPGSSIVKVSRHAL